MKNPFLWTAVFLGVAYWLATKPVTGWLSLSLALVALKAGAAAILSTTKEKPANVSGAIIGAALHSTLALVFVFHGLPKVLNARDMMGLPASVIFFVGLVETIGGLLMIVGPKRLRMLGALGLMSVMLTAIITVHLSGGLGMGNRGFEYPLVLLVLAWGAYVKAGGYCFGCRMTTKLMWPGTADADSGSQGGEGQGVESPEPAPAPSSEGGWDSGAQG
ncbi:DoxX family protein [bacterium]|nr:DoxX family protein [bacterium]